MLIEDQNNSHQSSLLIGPNGFLKSSTLMYLYCLVVRLLSFGLLKMFAFQINSGALNFATIFVS